MGAISCPSRTVETVLTQPLLRYENGKYDKEGEFTPITWDQAFDVMEEKLKPPLKEKGPESIGMFGSGQWTIWEGYAASSCLKRASVRTTSSRTRVTVWRRQ